MTVNYHTEQGKKEKIYFHMLDSAKGVKKAFEKTKESYAKGIL